MRFNEIIKILHVLRSLTAATIPGLFLTFLQVEIFSQEFCLVGIVFSGWLNLFFLEPYFHVDLSQFLFLLPFFDLLIDVCLEFFNQHFHLDMFLRVVSDDQIVFKGHYLWKKPNILKGRVFLSKGVIEDRFEAFLSLKKYVNFSLKIKLLKSQFSQSIFYQ